MKLLIASLLAVASFASNANQQIEIACNDSNETRAWLVARGYSPVTSSRTAQLYDSSDVKIIRYTNSVNGRVMVLVSQPGDRLCMLYTYDTTSMLVEAHH